MHEPEIFERHAERVLRFFVNKVRAPADASDLAQEVFTRFFERTHRGPVEHERAFLFGVANLVLKEYWRAGARLPAPLDPGERSVVEMGAGQTTLGTKLARAQGHQRMLEAMRRLRLDYQNVLELRYWHELKYDEIAEILAVNERTIGVWLRRAKLELRRILERMPEGPAAADAFAPRSLEAWLRRSASSAGPESAA